MRICFSLLLCLSAFFGPLHAENLNEWTFDDAAGTPLPGLQNSGSQGAVWSDSFDNSQTDGQGKFVSHKESGGVWNSYAPIPPSAGSKAWLLVEIAGWSFTGKGGKTLRFGFTHGRHPENPDVTVQIKLERQPNGRVVLSGDAFGPGCKPIEGQELFDSNLAEPLAVCLGLDKPAGTFSIYYKLGAAQPVLLGEGKVSPERDAKYLRLSLSGNYSKEGGFVALDRFVMADEDPLK